MGILVTEAVAGPIEAITTFCKADRNLSYNPISSYFSITADTVARKNEEQSLKRSPS